MNELEEMLGMREKLFNFGNVSNLKTEDEEMTSLFILYFALSVF